MDGKIVEELDLYHGSVISIGKTHFTIRNLAIPEMDAGFESGPVGGQEFATFSKKRRRFPVGLLLMVALVAGGLYVLDMLAKQRVKKTVFANPEGNLLKENYSFEGMTDSRGFPMGFRALQNEGDEISVQKGTRRTGEKSLLVTKAPGEDPAGEVEVIYGGEITVSPGKVYDLSAHAMPAGLQGVCGVKIVWLSRKDPSYRADQARRIAPVPQWRLNAFLGPRSGAKGYNAPERRNGRRERSKTP